MEKCQKEYETFLCIFYINVLVVHHFLTAEKWLMKSGNVYYVYAPPREFFILI